MGTQQVFRAALALVALASTATAAPRLHERVAVIDLGPGDDSVRQHLAAQIVAAGLDPVIGDGVEDALAGRNVDRDGVQLAAAVDEAKRKFGDLDCKAASSAALTAIGIASARQAAGLEVPELARAWAYVLLCADRAGNTDAAVPAAIRLRELGGSDVVDRGVLARYPDVDVLAGRDMIDLDIKADLDGAAVWIDSRFAGSSPLHVVLPAGEHVIAAAKGARRGYVTGTVIKAQPIVAIPTTDQTGPSSQLAERVRSWHGKMPAPAELAWVLGQIKARIVLVRHGDVVEAWGRISSAPANAGARGPAGRDEDPHPIGKDDGTANLTDAERLIALVTDRVHGWNDRAPDPDQPLLVEAPNERFSRARGGKAEEPASWWVYAAILGAIATGAVVIYAHDSAHDTQRVEVHYP